MGKRIPWHQLKPEYRERLERKGITPEAHAAGASLRAARGHEHTPERPGQYNPQQFPSYATERRRLIAQLQAKKERVFGESRRWSKTRSDKWIREKPPPIKQLRWAVNVASDEEILDAIRENSETFTFLGYH